MAKPASGKPSLIDLSPSSGGEEGNSLRMLDALEPSGRPATRAPARHGFRWLLAGLLLLVGCGASWSWWSQRSTTEENRDRMAQASKPVTTEPAKAASPPASAASAGNEPSVAATIVASADSEAVAAPPFSTAASGASAAASVPAASAPQAASAPPTTTYNAAAKPAKTKPANPSSSPDTRVAAQSKEKDDRKRPTTPAGKGATTSPSSDPDVALLSAMLATMSGDARATSNGAPNAQTKLTIAQLVKRCEVQGVKDAIETFECKRRICDGYWGKADACPMSLSPKKN